MPIKMMHDNYMSVNSDKPKPYENILRIEFKKLDKNQQQALRESMHTENIDNVNEEFELVYVNESSQDKNEGQGQSEEFQNNGESLEYQ